MKVNQADFIAALNVFRGIVETKPDIPILACVKIETGKMVLTDLDTNVTVQFACAGKIKKPIVTNFKTLRDIVAAFPSNAELLFDDATISFNDSVYEFATFPAGDFRTGPAILERGTVDILQAESLARVVFTMGNDETRYYLNGACLLNIDGAPHVCSTNGAIMSILPIKMPDGAQGKIIPRKLCEWISRMKLNPQVKVAGNFMSLKYPGIDVAASLIDGTYPDLSRAIPKVFEPIATFNRPELLSTLRRICVGAKKNDDRGVRLVFGEGACLVSGGRADKVKFTEKILCETARPEFTRGVNVDYLFSVAKNMRGEELLLNASPHDASSPFVFSSPDDSLKVILLGMRL